MIKKLILLAVIGTPIIGFSQNDSIISAKCISKIDSTYNALLKDNKVVGASIALVKDGKIIYSSGYGFQDRENNIKATENTVYRIGSCSKSFTALSLMQLQEKGKVDISQPIQKYLPQLTIKSTYDAANPLKINSILSHTSGLPNDLLNGFFCDNPPSQDWVIEQLNKCTMAAPANYQLSYSNIGYGILGKLIATISSLEYDNYLTDNIFTPLNMTSTFVDNKKTTHPNMSVGYMKDKAYDEVQIRDQAAGLIASSVTDMASYLNMYLANGVGPNGPVISEISLNEMQQNAAGNLTLPTSTEWGYGLYAEPAHFASKTDTTSVRFVGHGGDTWAFHADFLFIPELNIGAVVLTNSDNGGKINSAKKLLRIYLSEMEGKRQIYVKPIEKIVSKEQAVTRNEVVGSYSFTGINLQVKDPSKLKMKQGLHTIVMKEIADSLRYTGKIRLFGLFPTKIKNQEFKFVKLEDQVYLKVAIPSVKKEEFISKKRTSLPVSTAWKSKFGKYEPAGEVFTCNDCPYMDFQGIKLKLKEYKGGLVVEFKTDKNSINGAVAYDILSDEVAISAGIGRNTGETLRILENGNLFYSGFEFKLK